MQMTQQTRSASGFFSPTVKDMITLASRFPQKDRQGQARWGIGGGGASLLFEGKYDVISLKDGSVRERSPVSGQRKETKDIDIAVISRGDPFGKHSQNVFFRRYFTDTGIPVETTKGWYFYSPPPTQVDLVKVNTPVSPVLCFSPEYLSATHFKAVVEGRVSSTKDLYNTMMMFSDFDTPLFLDLVRKMPIAEAMNGEDIGHIIFGLRDVVDKRAFNRVEEISRTCLKRYYATNFGLPTDPLAIPDDTLRLLASGVGMIGNPTETEMSEMPKISDINSFWHAVYSLFGITRSNSDKIVSSMQNLHYPEMTVINLLSIAASLEQLRKLSDVVISRGGDTAQVKKTSEKLRDYVIKKFMESPTYPHPLYATFRGMFSGVIDTLETYTSIGLELFHSSLIRRMSHVVSDATQEHQLAVNVYA